MNIEDPESKGRSWLANLKEARDTIAFLLGLPAALVLFVTTIGKDLELFAAGVLILLWVVALAVRTRPRIVPGSKRRMAGRLSPVAIAVIPILGLAWFGIDRYLESQPPDSFIVLVADFDGPQPKNYQVAGFLLSNLAKELRQYKDIEVEALDKPITEQNAEQARVEGEKRKAAMVLWGSYAVTATRVGVAVHLEILREKQYVPPLDEADRGEVQSLPLASLNEFTFQIRYSEKLAYVVLFTTGATRWVRQDYDGAIEHLTGALEQPPSVAGPTSRAYAYFLRGSSYLETKDFPLAREDLDEAILLDRSFVEAYLNRGLLALLAGAPRRAVPYFDRALELRPRSFEGVLGRGVAYRLTGRYSRAIADLGEAIRLNPRAVEAYISRGDAYREVGKTEAALEDLNRAIEIEPSSGIAYLSRGRTYQAEDATEAALADYDKAIELDPRRAAYYAYRGSAHQASARAIADFGRAIELAPNWGKPYLSRGVRFIEQGEYRSALRDLDRAIELKANPVRAHLFRGFAYEFLGARKKAARDYRWVLAADPDGKARQDARESLTRVASRTR